MYNNNNLFNIKNFNIYKEKFLNYLIFDLHKRRKPFSSMLNLMNLEIIIKHQFKFWKY